MGMTIWFGMPGEELAEYDEIDRSVIYQATEALNELCGELKVKPLSEFMDFTDATLNMMDDGEEEDDDDLGIPTVDEMSWFEPSEGLVTVNAISKALQQDPNAIKVKKVATADLLDELVGIKAALENAIDKKRKFHLALIM